MNECGDSMENMNLKADFLIEKKTHLAIEDN